MLLFKLQHVELIWSKIKTHTRRRGKKRWKVGSIHICCTRLCFSKAAVRQYTFARVKIAEVFQQKLGDMTEADAYKEGGYTLAEYKDVWISINKSWDPDEVVWVVGYDLIEKKASFKMKEAA